MKKQLWLFIVLNIIFIIIGIDLKQKNPEEIFLSDDSYKELKSYEEEFGKDDLNFITNSTSESEIELKKQIEQLNGEYVSLSPLNPGSSVIRLPQLDDETKYHFFSNLQQSFPELKIAGLDYTNAQLAGMSIKIQKILFPIIFTIMFVVLYFLLKNLKVTSYLFLSSFIGVSFGLAITKLIYGYSTILTSLTPLVSFILTLASQLHVVFGMEVFKTKENFLKHKLAPILIMMITTIIGFASLIFSDLSSIRQFGVTATLTLTITWGINLLILKNLNLEFEIPHFRFLKKLHPPVGKPLLGFAIPFVLLGSGLYALRTMPTLVEALLFFPSTHEVRQGHDHIQKQFGGTPQIDLVVSRKDHSEFTFDDLTQVNQFESILKQSPDYKLLSSNTLIEYANEQYTQTKSIPLEKNAYFALKSQTPFLLQQNLVSEDAYKISILTKALENEDRLNLIKKITYQFSQLSPLYNIRISGLNTLLLNSQEELVKTLLTSLLGSFTLIALLFAFFSRNLLEILKFSLISLSSIFGGLFLMKLFGFSLNVASIMTLSISIGLVDDSTIHLLYAAKHQESEDQIRNSCIVPMILSHIVLFMSFLVLGFEPFVVIREFALGLVAMLFMGLILDLFVLPMMSRK